MKSDGVFFGDVLERSTVVPQAFVVKSHIHSGFPTMQNLRQPRFFHEEKAVRSTSSPTELSQSKQDEAPLATGCHLSREDEERNSEIVSSMSKLELQKAVQEIKSSFSQKSLEYLMMRNASVAASKDIFDVDDSSSVHPAHLTSCPPFRRNQRKSKQVAPRKSEDSILELISDPPEKFSQQEDKFDLLGRKVSCRSKFISNIRHDISDNAVFSVLSSSDLDALSTTYVDQYLEIGLTLQPAPSEESHSCHTMTNICQLFRSESPSQRVVSIEMLCGILRRRESIVSLEAYCVTPPSAGLQLNHDQYDEKTISRPMNIPLNGRSNYLPVSSEFDILQKSFGFLCLETERVIEQTGYLSMHADASAAKQELDMNVRRVLVFAMNQFCASDFPPELSTLLLWGVRCRGPAKIRVAMLTCMREYIRSLAEETAAAELWDGMWGVYGCPVFPMPHSRRSEESYENHIRDCMNKRQQAIEDTAGPANEAKEIKQGAGGNQRHTSAPPAQRGAFSSRPTHEMFALRCRWGRIDTLVKEGALDELLSVVVGDAFELLRSRLLDSYSEEWNELVPSLVTRENSTLAADELTDELAEDNTAATAQHQSHALLASFGPHELMLRGAVVALESLTAMVRSAIESETLAAIFSQVVQKHLKHSSAVLLWPSAVNYSTARSQAQWNTSRRALQNTLWELQAALSRLWWQLLTELSRRDRRYAVWITEHSVNVMTISLTIALSPSVPHESGEAADENPASANVSSAAKTCDGGREGKAAEEGPSDSTAMSSVNSKRTQYTQMEEKYQVSERRAHAGAVLWSMRWWRVCLAYGLGLEAVTDYMLGLQRPPAPSLISPCATVAHASMVDSVASALGPSLREPSWKGLISIINLLEQATVSSANIIAACLASISALTARRQSAGSASQTEIPFAPPNLMLMKLLENPSLTVAVEVAHALIAAALRVLLILQQLGATWSSEFSATVPTSQQSHKYLLFAATSNFLASILGAPLAPGGDESEGMQGYGYRLGRHPPTGLQGLEGLGGLDQIMAAGDLRGPGLCMLAYRYAKAFESPSDAADANTSTQGRFGRVGDAASSRFVGASTAALRLGRIAASITSAATTEVWLNQAYQLDKDLYQLSQLEVGHWQVAEAYLAQHRLLLKCLQFSALGVEEGRGERQTGAGRAPLSSSDNDLVDGDAQSQDDCGLRSAVDEKSSRHSIGVDLTVTMRDHILGRFASLGAAGMPATVAGGLLRWQLNRLRQAGCLLDFAFILSLSRNEMFCVSGPDLACAALSVLGVLDGNFAWAARSLADVSAVMMLDSTILVRPMLPTERQQQQQEQQLQQHQPIGELPVDLKQVVLETCFGPIDESAVADSFLSGDIYLRPGARNVVGGLFDRAMPQLSTASAAWQARADPAIAGPVAWPLGCLLKLSGSSFAGWLKVLAAGQTRGVDLVGRDPALSLYILLQLATPRHTIRWHCNRVFATADSEGVDIGDCEDPDDVESKTSFKGEIAYVARPELYEDAIEPFCVILAAAKKALVASDSHRVVEELITLVSNDSLMGQMAQSSVPRRHHRRYQHGQISGAAKAEASSSDGLCLDQGRDRGCDQVEREAGPKGHSGGERPLAAADISAPSAAGRAATAGATAETPSASVRARARVASAGAVSSVTAKMHSSFLDLCGQLIESCMGQYISKSVHSAVVGVLLSPAMPWRVRERVWREFGELQLVDLLEDEGMALDRENTNRSHMAASCVESADDLCTSSGEKEKKSQDYTAETHTNSTSASLAHSLQEPQSPQIQHFRKVAEGSGVCVVDSEQVRLSLSRVIIRALASLRSSDDRSLNICHSGICYIASSIFSSSSSTPSSTSSSLSSADVGVSETREDQLSFNSRMLSRGQSRLLTQLLDTATETFQIRQRREREGSPVDGVPDWLVLAVLQQASSDCTALPLPLRFEYLLSAPLSEDRFPEGTRVEAVVSGLRPQLAALLGWPPA